MELQVLRETEYVPKWSKNEKEAKPIKVKLRYLTPGERDECYEWCDGDLVPNRQKFFLKGVVSIENLVVNDEKLKTGQDVLDTPGLDGLFHEICTVILKQNARQDLKN